MAAYICGDGHSLSGKFTQFNIGNRDELSMENSQVLMVVNSSSDDKLLEYYSGIKNIIRNNNKLVIILDENNKSTIRKPLCMLAASYGCFNIYDCSMANLTEEYADSLLEREASELEVEKYIGEDIVAYDQAAELMLQIGQYVRLGNSDKLSDYIAENKEVILNIPVVLDFLKKVHDNHTEGTNRKVQKIQEALNESLNELESAKKNAKDALIKAKSKDEELSNLRIESETLKSDVNTLTRRNKDLEEQINEMSDSEFSSGGITSYTTLDVSTIKGMNKYIIYFKELSHVMYTTSMLNSLMGYLKLDGKRVKLVIYDKQNDFMAVHKGSTIVNGEKYGRTPDIIKNSKETIIVTDTNMAVLKEIMQLDVDVIIIYDLLKCADDLVEGTLVTKFYMAGSKQNMRDIEEATGRKFMRDRTFTENAGADTLTIPEINEFSKQADVARISRYASVSLPFGSGKITLFDHIATTCGISIS